MLWNNKFYFYNFKVLRKKVKFSGVFRHVLLKEPTNLVQLHSVYKMPSPTDKSKLNEAKTDFFCLHKISKDFFSDQFIEKTIVFESAADASFGP